MVANYSGYIERLSENILETKFENLNEATLENVKNRILDVVGCIISGAYAPGNLALIKLVKAWGGREEATILINGGKVPAYHAAMVNSIMARSYDFESVRTRVNDENIASHISGTTVPTALTLAEAKDISGKELITALLVGDDLACRLIAASGFGFNLGWDCVGTINAFGATAIAGRLLGLTKSQIKNAFGIVLNQLSGSLQSIWDGSHAFKLLQGLSAKNGIFSAELARADWTGVKDALFSKFGYFHLYTEGCVNPGILIEDLGLKYHTEATLKLYPCCRTNHAAVDCALKISKEYEKEIEQIDQFDEIILKVPARVLNMFVGQPFNIGAIPQIGAAFNIRYCVANVLLRKNITLEHFTDDFIRDPRIMELTGKISLKEIGDPDPKALGASLKLIMKSGKEICSEVSFARGEPVLSPLSIDDLKAKFMHNVAFSQTVSEKNAEKILSLIENLEEVDKVTELMDLMVV